MEGRPGRQRQSQKTGEAASGRLVTQKILLTFHDPVGVNDLMQVTVCHARLTYLPTPYASTNLAAFGHAPVRQLAQVGGS